MIGILKTGILNSGCPAKTIFSHFRYFFFCHFLDFKGTKEKIKSRSKKGFCSITNNHWGRIAGFTLLEVMIALAIVAGVVITALTSLNYHLKLIEDNENIIIATIVGMEKMEEIGLSKSVEKKEGDFGEGFPQFSYRVNIEDTEFKELKQINLKVLWEKDREVSYVAYKLER